MLLFRVICKPAGSGCGRPGARLEFLVYRRMLQDIAAWDKGNYFNLRGPWDIRTEKCVKDAIVRLRVPDSPKAAMRLWESCRPFCIRHKMLRNKIAEEIEREGQDHGKDSYTMDIMKQLQPIGIKYKQGLFPECIEDLKKLWISLPEPKSTVSNTYLIIEYMVRTYMKMKEFEQALLWGIKGTEYNGKRNLKGEAEFLLGEVAFEMGYFEFAKDMFILAKKRSHKQAFKEANPQYLKLLKGNDTQL